MLCAIPIEILNRELDGAIYLALHLAKQGLTTLFGERMVDELVFRLNPGKPVLYFDQDYNIENNNRILKAGGAVINLSTEGLIMEDSIQHSIYSNVVNSVSSICFWGQRQAEIISRILPPERQEVIQVTGHPSFDLLSRSVRSYYRDDEIIRKHGDDYILINTNFSTFNMKMDLDKYLQMLGRMKEWSLYQKPEIKEKMWAQREYQKRVFDEFIELVCYLSSEFPQRHIILRPHPMERQAPYVNKFKSLQNVFIDGSGSVRRWISSAGAVIHHDCTTGMEALLMDAFVIGYKPVFDDKNTCYLQSKIGVDIRTPQDAARAIRKGFMDDDIKSAQLEILHPYFANLERNAAESISKIAIDYARESKPWRPTPLAGLELIKCWRKHISKVLRSKQPGHNGRKVSYALEKFPRTPLSCVADRLSKLKAADRSLPNVKLSQLALNTFLIEPAH